MEFKCRGFSWEALAKLYSFFVFSSMKWPWTFILNPKRDRQNSTYLHGCRDWRWKEVPPTLFPCSSPKRPRFWGLSSSQFCVPGHRHWISCYLSPLCTLSPACPLSPPRGEFFCFSLTSAHQVGPFELSHLFIFLFIFTHRLILCAPLSELSWILDLIPESQRHVFSWTNQMK